MSLERVRCPACGRTVAARVPKGGDGTALRPVAHTRLKGGWCGGQYELVELGQRRGDAS